MKRKTYRLRTLEKETRRNDMYTAYPIRVFRRSFNEITARVYEYGWLGREFKEGDLKYFREREEATRVQEVEDEHFHVQDSSRKNSYPYRILSGVLAEWCLDDVKGWELKEGKRKARPKCGFASYDRYAPLSRSGSRYILATHRYSGIHAQNASRKFIWNQPSGAFPLFSHRECPSRPMVSLSSFPFPSPLLFFPLFCFTNSDVYRGKSRGRTGLNQRVFGTRKAVSRAEKKKRFLLLDESTSKIVYVCRCLSLYGLAFIRISTRCEISNRNCILNVSHAIEINDVLSRACSRDGWEKRKEEKTQDGKTYIYIYI